MRTKRQPETLEERSQRLATQVRERSERHAAEERSLDAAVRRSIELHGA